MTSRKEPIFAPREAFEQMLEYFVVPTFDLVIDVPDRGILLVRRKIAPYAGKWALPGLRMYKNEGIDDTLARIAEQEAGIEVDLDNKKLIGQYVGRFKTEHARQDLSTGYAVAALSSDVTLNDSHFSGSRFINTAEELPTAVGAMYRFYVESYLDANQAGGSTTDMFES